MGTSQRIGPYEILREIGRGSIGVVYEARVVGHHVRLPPGARVAVKVISKNLHGEMLARVEREAKLGIELRHPNVVETYDCAAGVFQGVDCRYIGMQLIEGQNLRELMQSFGRRPEPEALHIARQVASGLASIHARDAVHRDLKPRNLLIASDQVVKISDLGIAMLRYETGLTPTGAFVGTPRWAAPEMFGSGPVDGRADLYSLGLVMYELVSGVHPVQAVDLLELVQEVRFKRPRRLIELRSNVSPFYSELVETLMEKDADRRFASADELIQVLEEGPGSTWWTGRP